VLGLRNAEHQETAPGASNLVISKLVCSLAGQAQAIRLVPGTLARRLYGRDETVEEFRCNYGLNPEYKDRIAAEGLIVAGVDSEGEVRLVELAGHRFFMATLFLPQLSSSYERPHPLIVAYLQAAVAFRQEGKV
jgi:CTP synthase (UTP-ammonia lyase)